MSTYASLFASNAKNMRIMGMVEDSKVLQEDLHKDTQEKKRGYKRHMAYTW